MKLDIITLNDTQATFIMDNTTPYFVNVIRRILLSEIPKLAVNVVTVYDNTSPLFDEIIAHRLGLIPLPTQLDLLNFKDECACKDKGCPNCTVRYTLSKEGPSVVYSGDLQPEEKSWAVIDKKIPIVELTEGKRLILEVEANLGLSKNHVKWQVVHGAGYKYYPIIEIDQKKCDICGECVENCPKQILEIKKDKLVIKQGCLEKCNLCKTCVEKCKNDAIKVSGDQNKIIFHFETDGSFTAKAALEKALDILADKYKEFSKLLGKVK